MTADERPSLQPGQLSIQPGQPLSITFSTDEQAREFGITEEERSKIQRIGKTLKAYLQASRDLVVGRYAELRDYVPEHMTQACTPTVVVLNDGIIVRYDLVGNPELKVRAGLLRGSISEYVPQLSESVVYCPRDASDFDVSDKGLTFHLQKLSTQGDVTPIASTRIAMVAPIGSTQLQAQPGTRPIPIASVTSELEMLLECETAPEHGRREQKFLVRNKFRAPVGWRTIEVYPEFNAATWNPDIATLWAESVVLASVTRRNPQEPHYTGLGPQVAARRRTSELLGQLEEHLNGPEEPLHQFIRQHPQLLSPTHTSVWSKLPLGNRATDFVFKEPPTDYLLVELERATHDLFREDGQPKQELTHAINQVVDWRRYIEDNHDTVQRELGLHGISVNPRAVVVIGRRATLTPENARKLTAMENMAPRLKILTYDDVLTTARAAAENMLGPLWNPGPGAQVYFLPPR